MNFLNDAFGVGSFTIIVTVAPFLIIALIFLGIILRSRRKVGGSGGWMMTSGRILVSQLERRRSRSGGSMHTSLYPLVVYEYVVNGQRYQSQRVHFGMPFGSSFASMVQGVVDKYPVGSLVEVYYDPENPSEAVLERTAGSSNRLFTCIIVLILLVVIVSAALLFGVFNFMPQIIEQFFPR